MFVLDVELEVEAGKDVVMEDLGFVEGAGDTERFLFQL